MPSSADFRAPSSLRLSGRYSGHRRWLIEKLEQRLFLSAVVFHPPVHYDIQNPGSIREVAVGDLNNDGKPDLVEENSSDIALDVFLNKGGGVFNNLGAFAIPGVGSAITIGDFNHDGAKDLAVASAALNEIQIYAGLGNGTFLLPDRYAVGSSPDSIVTADLNGDGRLDLAFTAFGLPDVEVMLNNGNGTFAPAQSYGIIGNGASVTVGDFDKDHVADLAVVGNEDNHNGELSILIGNTIPDPAHPGKVIGDGTFATPGNYLLGKDSGTVAPGTYDFNGDGNIDLAVANTNSGTVSVLLGHGNGVFTLPTNYAVGNDVTAIGVGDFTHSGHVDLAVGVGGDIAIRQGKGDGTFQLPVSFPIGLTSADSLVAADFNADGRADVAVTDTAGLSVFLAAVPDTIAPKAALAAPLTNITRPDPPPYMFTVKYTDNTAIKVATVATGAIRVTGPHGYSRSAVLLSVDSADNGTPRTATYLVQSPGDGWDPAFNGTYTISLIDGKVADTSGNFARASTLGTFAVNITTGAIEGFVFNDLNSNGVSDPGDTSLTNVRVYIDANKNGVFDSTEKSLLTDRMGAYQFTNLAPGNYRIREVVPAARRISSPSAGYYDVSLAAGVVQGDKIFANTARPLLSGTLFNDANCDGVDQASEKGLANWTVYLDTNKNGLLDTTEVRTLTDASGNYAFRTLPTGAYRIREVLKPGFRRTSPSAGYYDVTLATGGTSAGKSFGDTTNVLITGAVFNDANGNKLRDVVKSVLEPGLANWRVYIDANNNGVFDKTETSVLTDSSGNWIFDTLAARAGAYIVRVAPQAGGKITTPTTGTPAGSFAITLTIGGASKTGLLFGEKHG